MPPQGELLTTKVWLTLKVTEEHPSFSNRAGEPRAIAVAKMTKTKPANPEGVVVELELKLPTAVFMPFTPTVTIEVPDDVANFEPQVLVEGVVPRAEAFGEGALVPED